MVVCDSTTWCRYRWMAALVWRVYLAETTLQREPMTLCVKHADKLEVRQRVHPDVLRGEIVAVKQEARPICDACDLLEHIAQVEAQQKREWTERNESVTNADKWGIPSYVTAQQVWGVDWAKPGEDHTAIVMRNGDSVTRIVNLTA